MHRTHRLGLAIRPWRLGSAMAIVVVAAGVVAGTAPAAGAVPSTAPDLSSPASAQPILDGEAWIAYDSFTRCKPLPVGCSGKGVWLVRPDGTGNHLITDDSAPQIHPDWSPDGERLAFTRFGGGGGQSIWVIAADGGDARQVVGCDAPCRDIDDPAWSPDGTRLAFRRYLGATDARVDATDIDVLDLATGTVETVLTGGDVEGYGHPRWSPDGRSLVVSICRYNADQSEMTGSAIATLALDGSATPTPKILTDWGTYSDYPDWHPTDGLILFTTYDLASFPQTDEPTNIYTIRPDGSGLAEVTGFGRADSRATQPSWTPDGRRIIFDLVGQMPGSDDNPRRIALIDEDGKGPVQVIGDPTAPVDASTASGHIHAVYPRLRPTPTAP